MDYSLNTVSRYLPILILVIEVYFTFTNLSYVILMKKYFIPLLQKSDQKLERYRCVAYLSRTLYLVCLTMYSSFEFVLSITINSTGWNYCSLAVALTYVFFSILCRVVFSWTRSVLIKYSVNLSYMWDTILLGFNSCFLLVILAWYLIEFSWDSYKWEPDLDNNFVIICFVSYVVYELLSFLLFYMPLKDATRLFGSSTDEYGKAFLSTNQQLDDMETGQDEMEDDHIAVLLKYHSDGSYTSSLQVSQNCLDLVTQFRKNVRRNLLAGVLTIIIGTVQCALCILYLEVVFNVDAIIPKEKMYFQDEFVNLILMILGLMQYVCMMITESTWKRAFIPFWFWQRKSWSLNK